MAERSALFNPLKLLLLVVADGRCVPEELAKTINTSYVLLEDLREKMNDQLRLRWKERVAELRIHNDSNRYGQSIEMQRLYAAALEALEGRFYEVAEKDYSLTVARYEEAIKAMSLTSVGQLPLVSQMLQQELQQSISKSAHDEIIQIANVGHALNSGLVVAGLWDWAGDAYSHVEGKKGDVRGCYERGLETLGNNEKLEELYEWRRAMSGHLSLSLATVLLAHFDEWEKAKTLIKNAADVVFFKRQERSNKEYLDVCKILVCESSDDGAPSQTSPVTPHIQAPVSQKYRESLSRLQAEIGQRALDTLREDYEKSDEGFPVPETYYLIGVLGELYIQLKEYDKCANLIVGNKSKFDDAFLSWTWEGVDEALNYGGFPFLPIVMHLRNQGLAEGMLQRPDYKEFVEQVRKAEESHQRQELRQTRIEKKLVELEGVETIQVTGSELVKKNPWLEGVVNLGSVVNAEALYKQLKRQNWGEVVVGFCNAVEEELKQFLYKEYLEFVAEQSDDDSYVEESKRQNTKGSVLYFIGSLNRNKAAYQIWMQFVSTCMKAHKEFLSYELPDALAELVRLRNLSAHGKMQERRDAERAHEIVWGTPEKPGLLKKLIGLKS